MSPWRPSSSWTTSRSCATSSSATSGTRSEEHTSELQSPCNLVCRLLLEKKKKIKLIYERIHLMKRACGRRKCQIAPLCVVAELFNGCIVGSVSCYDDYRCCIRMLRVSRS